MSMEDENEMFSVPSTEHGRGIVLFVLERLNEEWDLAATGHRYESSEYNFVPGSGQIELKSTQGLHTVISEQRLRHWYRNEGITESQVEPVLSRLKSSGLINFYEFFDGQWDVDDDTQRSLHIEFMANFETRYNGYKLSLYASASNENEVTRIRQSKDMLSVVTKHGLITLNTESGACTYNKVNVNLNPKGMEFDFLRKLLSAPNYYISYTELFEENTKTRRRNHGDTLRSLKQKLGILPKSNPERAEDVFSSDKLAGYRLIVS